MARDACTQEVTSAADARRTRIMFSRSAPRRPAQLLPLATYRVDFGRVVRASTDGTGGWIDALGVVTPTTAATNRAFTSITRGGNPVAGLIHDPALVDDPERLQAATEAASFAIDSERLKAQLHAQLAEVHASRARIAAAGDRELRRVERNLHDGAQQRLVGLALMLRLAGRKAAGDRAMTQLLDEAARELEDALTDLRELARGIHPAIVYDAGLGGALETLAERRGVPSASSSAAWRVSTCWDSTSTPT
jgi:signal transduction histidine kinase